ncbi:acetyl-CoA carboxylase biotin carboxyl carrier protein [Cupriavidus consociatus]|uniref:acetyl-CoA carboxylase biotin carboxyl carrier protein n=1 Tax=Cupriavidus consociatus TaxID=2821357 RepID=UPI001AE88A68|nr:MULTISPECIES: acetyl-CoA carboxylase biotin carboxyl carrier protein [unclassified Cupriavidus]MBP0622366.1 acetyl-CoA carboxylase biotin carboxyl carrier protein [Cupriavidus sp. LEh25]MDK2659051.1 acetyl-CoA carboxylase biotin carboxyl carrier protein [Cupriavidus sp. LEh21]
MDLKFVETLVGVLERSSALSEIEYSDGQRQLALKRTPTRSGRSRDAGTHVTSDPSSEVVDAALTVQPVKNPVAPAATKHTIAAGMIGTFYRSPAPEQPPFVAVGDTVTEGQTLAIVEAMKLLNPVEADRSGRITEILVSDGASVSPDTPLFGLEDLEGANV